MSEMKKKIKIDDSSLEKKFKDADNKTKEQMRKMREQKKAKK